MSKFEQSLLGKLHDLPGSLHYVRTVVSLLRALEAVSVEDTFAFSPKSGAVLFVVLHVPKAARCESKNVPVLHLYHLWQHPHFIVLRHLFAHGVVWPINESAPFLTVLVHIEKCKHIFLVLSNHLLHGLDLGHQ